MGKALYKALFECKKELGCTVSVDARGQYGAYASLEQVLQKIEPIAQKHGLLLLQGPAILNEQPILRTRLIHLESGEEETYEYLLTPDKPGPQGLGAAETYARRRTPMAIFGLATEDDPDQHRHAPAQRAQSYGSNTTSKPSTSERPGESVSHRNDFATESATCGCGNKMMVSKFDESTWYCGKCRSTVPRF